MVAKSTQSVRAWRERRRAAGLPIHTDRELASARTWLAETYRRSRADLLHLLGECCVGCGHRDIRVLEMDHIHDDGAEDRHRFKGARSMLTYYLSRPDEARERLQLLCRNCNWLKRRGEPLPCPSDGRTWDEFPAVGP